MVRYFLLFITPTRQDFSNILLAIIMQSTKDGKFKGSNEYAHNSDININLILGLLRQLLRIGFVSWGSVWCSKADN